MVPPGARLPLIVFEDDHLLVVNKPAGLNTHSPSPYAGEGIYEWLRNREPRWASLAIVHRLDKETSGPLVFGKTAAANKSLTSQFAGRAVRKIYVLVTNRPVPKRELRVRSAIGRIGDRYSSQKTAKAPQQAETHFRLLATESGLTTVEAIPATGRTHQIRVHASESGFPILGDTLYGGTPAERVHLHAAKLVLEHPITGAELTFQAESNFKEDARMALRERIIDPAVANAYRLVHGAADGWPGWYVDRLGAHLVSQSASALSEQQMVWLQEHLPEAEDGGVYHKVLTRDVRGAARPDVSAEHISGNMALGPFTILENGVSFELSFEEGYSVGLFLDQRDNRRRFLVNHVAAGFPLLNNPAEAEVLNTFAYTCGFSVCAARAGARTTSIDLSRKYLEWGRRNFRHNDLEIAKHDFIYGDVFDWLRRFSKKARSFDAIVLDPPTSSHSAQGFFTAEKHYGKLITAALPALKARGVLLACTNAASVTPEQFINTIQSAIGSARRRILQQHYVPQPPDFPITREEPPYFKTVWLRIS